MTKSHQLTLLAFVLLPILLSGCAPASTPAPPTFTPFPTNTPIPPTVTPTLTPSPTVVPSSTGTPIFPPIESFVGIWPNVDPNSLNWTKIEITSNQGTLSARFVLVCYSEEYASLYPEGLVCNEDRTSVSYTGNPVLMSIDTGSATYNFTLSLNGDTLHVTTFMDYTSNSGSADETLEDDFRRYVPSFPVSEQIVFYHFKQGGIHFVPEGSVLTPALLFPAASDEPHTSDTAADLRTALELVLQDERNGWVSSDLEIVDVTFSDGHADVVLQGEYSGESDERLNAASMQILLTVFANPAVHSASVTLNGDTIGNLGASSSTNAKPADFVYTRAEMETYLIEHAYVLP